MKPKEKFESLKDRYISAYKNCNKKNVVSLKFESGFVYLETNFGITKCRCKKFEEMTLTLEDRYTEKQNNK